MQTIAPSQLLSDPITGVLVDLPPLGSDSTGNLRSAVIAALRERDNARLKNILGATASLPPEVALRAVWLPLVLGLDAWETAGEPLPEGRALARMVRAQTRAALLTMPEQPVSRWLVPSTLRDTTAAHLAALALSLHGVGARVWSWPLPPPGPVLLVGDAGSPLPIEGRIPTLSDEPGWPTLAALVA
jgi:hypothetical protein